MRARWLAGGLGVFVVGVGLAVAGIAGFPAHGGLAPATVPSDYDGLIATYGNTCTELGPALLAAQLYVESGFNPDAVSSVGAEGIAQFMPATWTTHGVDANGDGIADIWDPADAIPSAAAYDCQLGAELSSVPGDVRANMLAAYNAGAYAVIGAGGVPNISETQNYVTRIRQLAQSFTAAAPVAYS